jgi:hypothetical protein
MLQSKATTANGKPLFRSVWITITVKQLPNQPPTANAGPDKATKEGKAVKLEGSATDPENDPLSYSWSTPGPVLAAVCQIQRLPSLTGPLPMLTKTPSIPAP